MRISLVKIVFAVFGFTAVIFLSCAEAPIMEFPSELPSSASVGEVKNYCVYLEIQQCYQGSYSVCPGVGGVLSNVCPFNSSSSAVAYSSSPVVGGSSSSQSGKSSSSSALPEFGYCVFNSDQPCLDGPLTVCPPGGTLSNSCPYGSSSSVVASSSSTTPSSSSIAPSSSSIVQSSSSIAQQSGIVYGPDVSYGGETYKTVVIGTQTWFQRNLNYNASGSVCYYNEQANCDTYGRLYNWATAKTACPSGWHLPSDAEWNILMKFVNSSCSDNSSCAGAGTKLKAKSGWNSNGNGQDTYGFSALPGGIGFSDGLFGSAGDYGRWWSASEYSSSSAYRRGMSYDNEGVDYGSIDKGYLFSVRCLQDYAD